MIIAYENIPYSQVFVASCINFVGNIIGIMSGRGRVKVGGASTCVDSSVPYSTIARRERSRKLAQRRRDTYKNIMEDLTGVCFKFLRCHVYILRIRYQIHTGFNLWDYFHRFLYAWHTQSKHYYALL